MSYYCYYQLFLVIIMISVNAKMHKQIELNKDIDCSFLGVHGASKGCNINNKLNSLNFVKPKRIQYFKYPNSTTSRLNLIADYIKYIFKERNENGIRHFMNEYDSLENDGLNTTVTKLFRSLNFNVTTIENTTWRYQDSKDSEEIDESKSTLIDYPFSVSIQRKGTHYASGALLDKWWIITSAGEFYHIRESLKLFRARLGSVDCKRGGVVIPIKKTEIHPYYLVGKPNFDVALLKMAYPIRFNDYIRPIAISNINAKVISAKFMITYWPRILVKGSALPVGARERTLYNSMRVSTQRLIPRQMCSRTMKTLNQTLNESSLCLKPVVTHHSACMPDAGAPVVAGDGLWGITSGWIVPSCPNITAPTIFTRLSSPSVRSWLDAELHSL